MGALTPAHLVLILIIALIVVGPGKLPEVGAAIGKSLKEFKKASGDITDNLIGTASQSAPPAQPVQQVAYQPVQPVAYQPVQPVAYQAPYQPAGGAIVPPPGQVAYPAPAQYYQPQPDPAAGFAAQPGQVAYPAPAPFAPAPLAPAPFAPTPDAYQPVTGVVVEPPSGPKAG